MNGLQLSRRYYNDLGKSIFESTFKSLMDRVAIGLVGPGSECLGFDDEYSRDHDWGPCFCMWMTDRDFEKYGRQFKVCYDKLPREFSGFPPRKVSPGETGRVGPMTISGFYSRYTGLGVPPKTLTQWDIPSANMVLCTNGEVFSDPPGHSSQWRRHLLDFYPEDLRLKKMADCCMHAGQSGQYNWQRGILRNDPFVIATAKNRFCTEIIQMIYLLNKQYAPYFKWMFKGVAQLPILGKELAPHMEKIMKNNDEFSHGKNSWYNQQETMEMICKKIVEALQNQGLTDANGPFLIDHVPSLLGRISDPQLKSRLWQGK